jgi:thioesterase domain-containing protein
LRLPLPTLDALQHAYHTLIPISKHMGLQAQAYDGQCLRVSAPLANNVNHQQSAFGGSLFSVVALAGWGILQLKITEMDLDCNTVIAGGEVSYQLPVFSELVCECRLPPDYPAFAAKLRETGKASILLETAILVDNTPAMTFSGKYVVRQTPPTQRQLDSVAPA